jgi:glutamate formiminotransferase/formiminotetrahydrofolate cyclodeaminase
MRQLVECVPNFSEGRKPKVIEAVVAAISVAGGRDAEVLDVSSDADHNRSVVTVVGSPAGVEAAAFAGIAKAAELIDLNKHSGGHPRMGATDVCPFVPVSGVTMDDCVEIAKRLGERVGRELKLPVFLYEAAAQRPNRQNLASIRRGKDAYKQLKGEIGSDPDRAPDFGPSKLGPAGATAISARAFLIAYNVYLNTDKVEIAQEIGKAVRHLSGGLRYVKGMGLMVDGQAQVSMNLTDYTKTPIPRVVETIRREAQRYGVSITHSELVGLIPQAALVDAAKWYLQLNDLQSDQVLENRLGDDEADGGAVGTAFIDELAADSPTPGGGAAAAYSGAMAAGLVGMVARLTVGRKKYADVESEMKKILRQAEKLRAELTAAITDDSAAFDAVMDAFKLPKETAKQQAARGRAIQKAMSGAAAVPLQTARAAAKTLDLAAVAGAKGNINAISDAGTAAHLCHTALAGAALNVRINAESIKDRKKAAGWLKEISRLEASAAKTLASTVKVVAKRM